MYAQMSAEVPIMAAIRPTGVGQRVMGELESIEICAGGGGQAIGLEQAGFGHVARVENDSHACASFGRALWPKRSRGPKTVRERP